MTVLIDNTQTEGAIPEQIRSSGRAARRSGRRRDRDRAPGSRVASWHGRSRQLQRPGDGAAERDAPRSTLDDVARPAATAIWSEGTFCDPAGAIVGVIGPNGSGKTTLLEMVLGLLPRRGRAAARCSARPPRGQPPDRLRPAELHRGDRRGDPVPRPRGARPQRHALGPRTAVRRRPGRGRRRARRGFGRTTFADRAMSQLSGGQQQRVAIAQALVGDPELLLLDEPLANLDVRNQHEIVALLGHLPRDASVTILVVVHDLNPLLSILTGAIYLLDGHAHYGAIGDVVDSELLTHLYDTPIKVVRTAQGDLFTRS